MLAGTKGGNISNIIKEIKVILAKIIINDLEIIKFENYKDQVQCSETIVERT
jgi:hypothetical protein